MITTENLTVNRETCAILDRVVYANAAPASRQAYLNAKAAYYRVEIVNLIANYDKALAAQIATRGLVYLYDVAARVTLEHGRYHNERGIANASNATAQLKNWR